MSILSALHVTIYANVWEKFLELSRLIDTLRKGQPSLGLFQDLSIKLKCIFAPVLTNSGCLCGVLTGVSIYTQELFAVSMATRYLNPMYGVVSAYRLVVGGRSQRVCLINVDTRGVTLVVILIVNIAYKQVMISKVKLMSKRATNLSTGFFRKP